MSRADELAQRPFDDALRAAVDLVLTENRAVLSRVDSEAVEHLAQAVLGARRVIVCGAGRSGLVMRAVAMRLMHLDEEVFVVGETTTPALGPGDVLIACSGSGGTEVICLHAQQASAAGARVAAVTARPQSRLGRMADVVVEVLATTKHDRSDAISGQFAGSLFEQSALLLFDALFYVLSQRRHEDDTHLWRRHANLE